MSSKSEDRIYLILDTENSPLGSGQMESPPGADQLRLLVLDNKADEVSGRETVELMSLNSNELPMRCRVLRQRGDRVILEKVATLDSDLRRNLRVNVQFDSFIYPVSGKWKGRRPIQSIDLSCGGIAFYSNPGLEEQEVVEIVVPITSEGPVLLRCQLLKEKELEDGKYFYAAKFVDMCEDEEVTVREAVFSLQLESRSKSK